VKGPYHGVKGILKGLWYSERPWFKGRVRLERAKACKRGRADERCGYIVVTKRRSLFRRVATKKGRQKIEGQLLWLAPALGKAALTCEIKLK